uniref:IBR domain-containing protein n=1 Tax=Timspurckia oligopyrenoides TaxID=708627 RepID=A0A7S1EPU3_9RHOD|mmetsp:Transcript_10409/g.18776  ORF Transcript_10409/g.18776 Transcript_10409/m.18776 type:complete len:123 (+) Transcript_10409:345-713(+)
MELKQNHLCRLILPNTICGQLWCIEGGMKKKNGNKNRLWNVLHGNKCPGCGVRGEKRSGCSSMHCLCRKAHFCLTCRGYFYENGDLFGEISMNRNREIVDGVQVVFVSSDGRESVVFETVRS